MMDKTQLRGRIIAVSIFIAGIVLGNVLIVSRLFWKDVSSTDVKKRSNHDYKTQLTNSFKTENLEKNLRYFTRLPHFAGSVRNNELARYMASQWIQHGFDRVEMPSYDVLVSLPEKKKPSKVEIVDGKGEVKFRSQLKEKLLTPEHEGDSDIIPPGFVSFSASGSVAEEVVYVNYGKPEDLQVLDTMGVSLNGKIALVRMGRLYRGNKMFNVVRKGASAVLLYMDPAEFAPEGLNNTFPKSWWLPESGTQRGAASRGGYSGDPLTPGFPSTEGIYRQPIKESMKNFPPVPALVLSYGDAIHILKRMKGPKAPDDWQGGLDITYKIGPGFQDPNLHLRMEVHNKLEKRTMNNVVATINGREEPDRYVIIGNHRDAWVYGASDPSSGTSILMELSRGLGELLKSGWRPRRTIMLCSWDGEEIFLFGSTEWVEENAKILSNRAVAYLNMDIGVSGNFTFNVDANSLLQDIVLSTTKEVRDPTVLDDDKSLYDVMLQRDTKKNPKCIIPAAGSDYAPFYNNVGVNIADWAYIFGKPAYGIRRAFPVYHSVYDSFEWIKTFIDPQFTKHLANTKYAGLVLLKLTDSPLLPLSTSPYAKSLQENFKTVLQDNTLVKEKVNLKPLSKAIHEFTKTVEKFENTKNKQNETKDFAKLRVLNDQMTQLEKMFLAPLNKPSESQLRNVYYGIDPDDIYEGIFFPRVQVAIKHARKTNDWEQVKKEISTLLFCVNSAIKHLTPITAASGHWGVPDTVTLQKELAKLKRTFS